MASVHPIPQAKDVMQMVAMLYGNDAAVADGDVIPADSDKSMVAVFVSDDDQPVTACVYDWEFAAYAGSALTRIPQGGAEDAAKDGDFSEMMMGNVREFMNICSRLFMTDSSPHLRLGETYKAGDARPESVSAMVSGCAGKAGFTVSIPNYGSGKLSFIAT